MKCINCKSEMKQESKELFKCKNCNLIFEGIFQEWFEDLK